VEPVRTLTGRSRSSARRKPRRSRKRRARLLPSARARRRLRRTFLAAPPIVQIVVSLAVLVALALAVNWIYQVVRKPTELLFPVSGTLNKMPTETWRQYGPLFRRHSTAVMTPELLAALAQVEGSGNPVARTYWRWAWSSHVGDLYKPASSAVGMYQITDGTFQLARRYCIHDHRVVEEGDWNDWHACWFNSLYLRVLPGDAIELTSAYLDLSVSAALARFGARRASLKQQQELAALIHLCGAGAGEIYVRRGFRLAPGQRCGDHDAAAYIARVSTMREVFVQLARRNQD